MHWLFFAAGLLLGFSFAMYITQYLANKGKINKWLKFCDAKKRYILMPETNDKPAPNK